MTNLPQNLESIMKVLGSKRKFYEGTDEEITEADKVFKAAGADPEKNITWSYDDYGSKEQKMFSKIVNFDFDADPKWGYKTIICGYMWKNKRDNSAIYVYLNGVHNTIICCTDRNY